jgi:uncharacterized protein YecT (DUF1311 family)
VVALPFFNPRGKTAIPARGQNAKPGSTPSSQEQNCDRAETQMEINQCSTEKYQKADALLNELYSKLIRQFQTDVKEWTQKHNADQTLYETKGLEEPRAAERAWVQYVICIARRPVNGWKAAV